MDHKLETEIVTYGVHHLIKEVLTLKSAAKKYPLLNRHNEARIVKLLLEDKLHQKSVFVTTYQQRKKHTDQLWSLMNDVLRGVILEQTQSIHSEPSSKSSTKRSSSSSSSSSSLQSQYISIRFLADKYIREHVMTNPDTRLRIVALIRKQHKFQLEHETSRRQLLLAVQKEGPQLSKLASHNKQVTSAKKTAIVDLFDAEFYAKCSSMARETSELLAKLDVPFFNTHLEYRYPELEQDKAYMLDLLVQMLKDEIDE